MIWPTASLGDVAPAEPSNLRFEPDERVWHLTLDQIETGTGRIATARIAPASDAGTSTYVFDTDNVLYSKLRPYLNKVVRPNSPGIATTELVPLRPRPTVLLAQFLAYFLRAPGFVAFASARTAGTKMPRVIMSKFWEHEIPLPPLSEQRRIVQILDQADRLRRLRAEADGKAARILPALYRRLFLDRASDWPTQPLGTRLRKTKGALQSGPFGSHLHNSDFVESGPVRVVGIDNVLDGEFSIGRNRRITAEKYEELRKYTLEPGDVLVTVMGTVGRTCVFPRLREAAICTKHVYRVQVDERLDPEYLSASMRFAPAVRAQLGASITGQIVAGITSDNIRRLELLIPPRELQDRFATHVRTLAGQRTERRQAFARLDRLFAALLRDAFSGELTANWREAHMNELLREMEHQATTLTSPARNE